MTLITLLFLQYYCAASCISKMLCFQKVGYVDVEGRSFGFASGPRTPKIFPPSAKNPSGNATGLDTFLIGSGTKTFTATAGKMLL